MAKQVLLIDDNHNTIEYLSAVLSDHGYESTAAFDGEEGLEKIKQTRPDLVVLDVMMPKRTGFTLFKMLKRDEELKDIPVLMLTAVSGILEEMEEHSAEDTFESPFDNLRESLKKGIRQMREEGLVKPEMFVDKPVDVESFITKVKELIGE